MLATRLANRLPLYFCTVGYRFPAVWHLFQDDSGTVDRLAILLYSVNVFHQGGTLFHFFDRRNRAYYSSNENRLNYIILPLLAGVAGMVIGYFSMALLSALFIIWSMQHNVQQNMGINLLYHNHNKGEAIVARDKEVRSQHAAAYFFLCIFFWRMYVRDSLPPIVMQCVVAATFLYFAYAVSVYVLVTLAGQVRKGAYINRIPSVMFWLISIFLSSFLSPLLAGSYVVAALIPSFLHWVQYIGINYVLIKRKYASEGETENLLIKRPMLLFVGFCSLLVLVQFGSITYGTMFTEHKNFWNSLLISTGFVHYALDGRISGKFREAYSIARIFSSFWSEHKLCWNVCEGVEG